MLLFVGLGNPGAGYSRNRHNFGFMVVDAIAKRHRFPRWRPGFQGLAAKGAIGGEDVLLLLPGTYMNESGRAVREAMHFFKVSNPNDIVVFHDEIELPPAKLKVKIGGGIAGHNGLRSISAYIGNDYKRVRLGVAHPGAKHLVEPYVLSNFSGSELPWVEALCDVVADNAELLAQGKDASFQNKVHLAMDAKGFGTREDSED